MFRQAWLHAWINCRIKPNRCPRWRPCAGRSAECRRRRPAPAKRTRARLARDISRSLPRKELMPLRDLLCNCEDVATAVVATSATPEQEKTETIATIASVAVANTRVSKISEQHPLSVTNPAEPCRDWGSGLWRQVPRDPWHCDACLRSGRAVRR